LHLQVSAFQEIDDGSTARDLMQPAAPVVILSAADSELASLRSVLSEREVSRPAVALTNFLLLGHPMSVDLFVDRTLAKARFIVLRLLGGEGYWPHGIASLRRLARERAIPFACLPGDACWDDDFARNGTIGLEEARALWRYFAEGGAENMRSALAFIDHALGAGPAPSPPWPVPSAGFWPERMGASERPRAVLLFYRALVQGGMTEPVEALAAALEARGIAVQPIFVTSLKDEASAALLLTALAAEPPDVILNATAFAVGTPQDEGRRVLDRADCPVLQVAFAGTEEAEWRGSSRGLTPRDLAMNVVLPEVDGRIFAGAVSFKARNGGVVTNRSVADRVAAAADLAAAWVRLRRTSSPLRRVVLVLANYPNRDGRIANGVGLDTPESCVALLEAMRRAGYDTNGAPSSAAALMAIVTAGPTNALGERLHRSGGETLSLGTYRRLYRGLPEATRQAVEDRWGAPEDDPFVSDDAFRLGIHVFGRVAIGVQPARGYNIDPKDTYHAPDLAPPHNYLAFYLWMRETFGAHAVLHLGKHGNLEWLPGKSVGLSAECFPQATLGPVPNIYPFIVNDPGEGMQAKRRNAAVIVDHLTPPMARAELHGDLAEVERLVDEYALAADLDPRRADALAKTIAASAGALRLDADLDLGPEVAPAEMLRRLDAHLCDLKELQIRDGLHVLGRSPDAERLDPMLVAVARLPRSDLRPADASLHRALAVDLGLGDFDPLGHDLGVAYDGPRPDALRAVSDEPWRHAGDTVERIERLAEGLVRGEVPVASQWERTPPVLDWIATTLRPAIVTCGDAETQAVLTALDGRFVPPGPSGAPTRGRSDVLPTGRNFFAVDTRAVPSEAAWRTGRVTAERLLERYWQEEGEWPRSIALSCWGTANMRTGGDDIAQAMALIGAKPTWEPVSGRVTGFQIMRLEELLRPRIDVTLRVSGLFRDAFPTQIDLFDTAVRTIAALDEPDDENPIAAHVRQEASRLGHHPGETAAKLAATRVFGSKPGAYGAGLQALIDEGGWETRADLAGAYRAWSSFAYGAGQEGDRADALFDAALARADAVIQSQDNREHDILDSDDYYQFMGGLSAAVSEAKGRSVPVFHLDTSRPEAPVARALDEEISRVVRGRAANPKWIAGVMRHGYKGAFEMAATVDYLFGFAASTDAVKDHHFDQLFAAYLEDETARDFMQDANPAALRETADRFAEAIRRGLWRPRSNSAVDLLARLQTRPQDPSP
jgi:cobaltochelatase CobN